MASIRKREWISRGIARSAWVVDYFDHSGKRHLKTFKMKKAAEDWATSTLHEVKQGIHTAASASVTVNEAVERWLVECEANALERSTIEQRRQHLNLHIALFMGREKLSALTTPRIHQFDRSCGTAAAH
jgi:integrase